MRQFEQLGHHDKPPRITPVHGGHMSYERLLIQTDDDTLFAKIHDASQFTDPTRERHSREYLIKEHAMMEHLRQQSYEHVPIHSHLLEEHSLTMEGLSPEDGWHWRAPQTHIDQYIDNAMAALLALEEVDHPYDFLDSHAPAYEALINEGWHNLDTDDLSRVTNNLQHIYPRLCPSLQPAALDLLQSLPSLHSQSPNSAAPTRFCHHDLRQANVAWHPEHGVRIVDWSWAGTGLAGADRTSLLVDLHKSGHDVSAHLEDHFNPAHAHILLGFLLSRSIAPTRDSDKTVRFHQAVSAVSTYSLLSESGH